MRRMMMDVWKMFWVTLPAYIKLIYAWYLTFQNPTGNVESERRREQLELSAKYSVAVIEDNPYGELEGLRENLALYKVFWWGFRKYLVYRQFFGNILVPASGLAGLVDKDIHSNTRLMGKVMDLQCNTITRWPLPNIWSDKDIDKLIYCKNISLLRSSRNVTNWKC